MQDELAEWLLGDGGLLMFSLIAAGLFVFQGILTLLLWRKGEEKYLFKFITYFIAAGAILVGSIIYIVVIFGEGMPSSTFTGLIAVFVIMAAVACGMQIFFFIRDTWLQKEAKS